MYNDRLGAQLCRETSFSSFENLRLLVEVAPMTAGPAAAMVAAIPGWNQWGDAFFKDLPPRMPAANFSRFIGPLGIADPKNGNDHGGEWNPGWVVYPTYIQLIDTL